MARRFGLLTAEKKDSQGLCFMGNIDMKEFLGRYIPVNYGDVVDMRGRVVGSHNGIAFSTIGQRHGFTTSTSSSLEQPYYVIQKDTRANTLVVSHLPLAQKTDTRIVYLEHENWIAGTRPSGGDHVARFRHRQVKQACKLFFDSTGKPVVQFKKPQVGLSSGQSLVLYSGSLCIGGGVME